MFFYKSWISLMTVTWRISFSIWFCCHRYDPVTPDPFCNAPCYYKPHRQGRAKQSRCYAHCCLLVLETLMKTCLLSPRHDAIWRGQQRCVACTEQWGWTPESHQPPRFPDLSPPPPWLNTDIHHCKFVQWLGKFCNSICWGCLDEMYSMVYAANVKWFTNVLFLIPHVQVWGLAQIPMGKLLFPAQAPKSVSKNYKSEPCNCYQEF